MTTTTPSARLAPGHAASPGPARAALRSLGALALAASLTTGVLLALARFVEAGA
jgi:hypothetical protein